MPTTINMYCDESCHLEHDGINVMGLGAVWCDKKHVREINERIREIKKGMEFLAILKLNGLKLVHRKNNYILI